MPEFETYHSGTALPACTAVRSAALAGELLLFSHASIVHMHNHAIFRSIARARLQWPLQLGLGTRMFVQKTWPAPPPPHQMFLPSTHQSDLRIAAPEPARLMPFPGPHCTQHLLQYSLDPEVLVSRMIGRYNDWRSHHLIFYHKAVLVSCHSLQQR